MKRREKNDIKENEKELRKIDGNNRTNKRTTLLLCNESSS